jgi:hypothetical protein
MNFKRNEIDGKIEIAESREGDSKKILVKNNQGERDILLTVSGLHKRGLFNLSKEEVVVKNFGEWEGTYQQLKNEGIISSSIRDTPYGPVCQIKDLKKEA